MYVHEGTVEMESSNVVASLKAKACEFLPPSEKIATQDVWCIQIYVETKWHIEYWIGCFLC